jgi:hypothetical protein
MGEPGEDRFDSSRVCESGVRIGLISMVGLRA